MRGELVALCALVLVAACDGAPCVRHSDCDPGLVCSPTGACLVPSEPDAGDGGVDAAIDAAIDASPDAVTDAPPDAGTDAATDAASDAPPAVDAAIDAAFPSTLESEYAGPAIPEVGLPHALTTRSEAPR